MGVIYAKGSWNKFGAVANSVTRVITSRRIAEQDFSLEDVIAKHLAIYRELSY